MEEFTGNSGETWRFDPTALIGEPGGMGQVFSGFSSGGLPVAIKKIPKTLSHSAGNDRLPREIEIGIEINSRENSNHLLKNLDWGRSTEAYFIVMPMAQFSLTKVLNPVQGVGEAQAIQITKEIVKGLIELSELSIIHRDLKPANILKIGEKWVLADFGISRDLKELTAPLTYRGFGSMPYLAPEIWQGKASTTKSDLYSLGVIIYELLEGNRPFEDSEMHSIGQQHTSLPPPKMIKASTGMETLVLRLLSKSPEFRPKVVDEVLRELSRLGSPPANLGLSTVRLAMAARQKQLSETEALEMAEMERYKQILAHRSEALQELDRVFKMVEQDLKNEIPNIVFRVDLRKNRILESPEMYLQLSIWDDLYLRPSDKIDSILLAGAVTLKNSPYTRANLVCEFDNGKYEWKILEFRASGAMREYKLGNPNYLHGFEKQIFEEQRSYMLSPVTHVWTMTVSELSVEKITVLAAEGINL